jgi:Dolichyl-phosphate-mannose-protein mannosyltransferase
MDRCVARADPRKFQMDRSDYPGGSDGRFRDCGTDRRSLLSSSWLAQHTPRRIQAVATSASSTAPLPLSLALYVLALVTFATVTSGSGPLHHDMTEAWAWGKEFQLGYAKHPPLTAWVVGLWFAVMPRTNWSFFLLSGLNVAVALAGVWMLASIFLDIRGRMASILCLMLTPSFSLWALRFNVNAPLISTWPWTTYFFLRSLETRRIDFSLCAGLVGAMALLTKYYSLVLFATLLLVAILHPDRRRYFASPAPYLTNGIGILALAPHVWWTINAGFPTVEYAISRTEFEVGIARTTSIKAICGAVGALGIAAGVYAFSFGAQSYTLLRRSVVASFNRQYAWLTCLAYGPLVLTVAAYVFFNARIASGFLLPAFFALPTVFLVLSRANVTGAVIRKMVRCVATIWLTLVAVSPLIAYYEFAVGEHEYFEPRREIAVEATRLWNSTFGKPLRYVSGDIRLATAMTFYSSDNPSYFIYQNPEHSPWASIARTHRDGVLFICHEITDWCISGVEAYVGPTAIRSTLQVATHFVGREGKPQRFVLFMRPPG